MSLSSFFVFSLLVFLFISDFFWDSDFFDEASAWGLSEQYHISHYLSFLYSYLAFIKGTKPTPETNSSKTWYTKFLSHHPRELWNDTDGRWSIRFSSKSLTGNKSWCYLSQLMLWYMIKNRWRIDEERQYMHLLNKHPYFVKKYILKNRTEILRMNTSLFL